MYGKDGEKMIPPVRIHGRKCDVEEWSMFKEIRDERAFNAILNQIIENIQNGRWVFLFQILDKSLVIFV